MSVFRRGSPPPMLLLPLLAAALADGPKLCAPDDPRLPLALSAWGLVDQRVRGGDPEALADVAALLNHPCLDLARAESQVPLRWAGAPSLSRWWRDGGGRWLRSYLDPADFERVFLPPDPRAVLGPPEDAAAPDPLASLRCPAEDAGCGAQTLPWAASASAAFLAHAVADTDATACDLALAEGGYVSWRQCLGITLGRSDALPLGRLRAPEAGWLVIRGPRGGLEPCQTLDVVELSTGSVWRQTRCPGQDAMLVAGVVEPALAQELAWSLLLLSELQEETRAQGLSVPLPEGVERAWPAFSAPMEVEEEGLWSSSQTYLSWAWTPPEGEGPEVVAGYFAWPWSRSAGEDHVDKLLVSLELHIAPACPPLRPHPELRAARCAEEPPGLLLQGVDAAELLTYQPPECAP